MAYRNRASPIANRTARLHTPFGVCIEPGVESAANLRRTPHPSLSGDSPMPNGGHMVRHGWQDSGHATARATHGLHGSP
jgi:hypothetical protein